MGSVAASSLSLGALAAFFGAFSSDEAFAFFFFSAFSGSSLAAFLAAFLAPVSMAVT